jgi:hypothetical protein
MQFYWQNTYYLIPNTHTPKKIYIYTPEQHLHQLLRNLQQFRKLLELVRVISTLPYMAYRTLQSADSVICFIPFIPIHTAAGNSNQGSHGLLHSEQWVL